MKYTIECSYGEILDKISILQIKYNKSNNEEILNEISSLKNTITFDEIYFKKLFDINSKLWILEDLIRLKSSKQEFDSGYIKYAEDIHKINDIRFSIKKELNEKYDSDIKEYKIYQRTNDLSQRTNDHIEYDQSKYTRALKYFENGDFVECNNLLKKLLKSDHPDVYFSYEVSCRSLGIQNEYSDKLSQFIELETSIEKKEYFNKIYCMKLLHDKEYSLTSECMKYIQPVNVTGKHNIHPDTMSYFNKSDESKTLLVYTSGGIGDKIMYSRFIKEIAIQQKNNKILFLLDDNLLWMFEESLNLEIIPFSQRDFLPHFDYHTNITMLFHHLNLDYSSIYNNYYLKNVDYAQYKPFDNGLKNIVINWKGNSENVMEKNNRSIPLNQLIPLFKIKGINWVTIQKESIPKEELSILKKYKVNIISADKGKDSFRETLGILKQSDLVISTDTSLVHIAGSADINCFVILSRGCDWRWTNDSTTNWYPKLTLFRQKKQSDWSNVISELITKLS